MNGDLEALGLGRGVERKLRDAILALCERETDAYIERREAPSDALRELAQKRERELSVFGFSLRYTLADYLKTGELYLTPDDRAALQAAKAPRRRRRPPKASQVAPAAPRPRERASNPPRRALSGAPARALPRSVDLADGAQLLLPGPNGDDGGPQTLQPKRRASGTEVGMTLGAVIGGVLGALADAGAEQKRKRGAR